MFYNQIIETKHGAMICNKNDIFITKCLEQHGSWGLEEIQKTAPYARGTVLDIGANIGTHTLSYAKIAKHVIAFEPLVGIYNVLCGNLALNCIENVSAFPFAIGNSNGVIPVLSPDYTATQNYGSCSVGIGDVTCPIRTIDSMYLDGITLIKVDVEGYEIEVLKGATDTINRCRPVLYIEDDRRENSKDLHNAITSLGYFMSLHATPIGESFPDVYSLNLLCLPKETV